MKGFPGTPGGGSRGIAWIPATLVLCLLAAPAVGSDFYVSPTGSPSGSGSVSSPWDLQTALAQPAAVHPGDTLWLRGGTYVGTFTNRLTGTSVAPITVRPYPGERATLDGNAVTTLAVAMNTSTTSCTLAAPVFTPDPTDVGVGVVHIDSEQIHLFLKTGASSYTVDRGWNGTTPASHSAGAVVTTNTVTLAIYGAYTWFMGLEIMNSSGVRTNSVTGSLPPDRLGFAVDTYGPGTRIINCVVHDAGQGIGLWTPATNSEVYGNLIYYNGWDAPDRGHGHGVYTQNQAPSTKRIADNILFEQFALGVQAYTEGGNIDDITLEGNAAFNNGGVSTGGFSNNLLYGGLQLANFPSMINNVAFYPQTAGRNNLGYSSGCVNATTTGNYFAAQTALKLVSCGTGLAMTGNTFYGALSGFTSSQYPSNTYLSSRPSTAAVFVRPNQYETGRETISVFNWGNQSTVTVDVTGVVPVNAGYEVRNAQNFFGSPVLSGTSPPTTLALPMNGLTPASVIGYPTPPAAGPDFNVFVLLSVPGPWDFWDVPFGSPYRPFINTVAKNGITAGCGSGNYCPDSPVTRAQMAVFVLRGEHGSAYVPPPATGTVFSDVPASGFAAAWIERLAAEGITAGCGGGLFCPNLAVTRAQMTVFLLRAKFGPTYVPPPATGIFADVPVSDPFAKWIEKLYTLGITAGCGTAPLRYCPSANVTRAQMAVFLVTTFALS